MKKEEPVVDIQMLQHLYMAMPMQCVRVLTTSYAQSVQYPAVPHHGELMVINMRTIAWLKLREPMVCVVELANAHQISFRILEHGFPDLSWRAEDRYPPQ